MYNAIVFYIASALLVIFGILMLAFKNVFYSLISAIMVFFISGIFFFILGSEYNAVIQLAVYGFAVPIILGIAVMFTNMKAQKKNNKESNSKYIVFLTGGIFALALTYLVMTSLVIIPDGFNICVDNVTVSSAINNIVVFSKGIFVRYVWAFELVSLLLTIIVAGLVLTNRRGGIK